VKPTDVTIVDVRTLIVDGGWRNWIFVEVATDEGITGYGECTLEGRENAVVGVVEDFRRHLVGEPAGHIRRLFRRMTRHGYWEAGPVVSSGAGGIEVALWDILGKCHGVPVASLLGGPLREDIDVYSNAWYFGAESSADFAACARRTVALGYRALKFDPFAAAEFHISDRDLGRSIEKIEAVRDAVGPDISLMIEGHGRFGAESALRVIRRLEPLAIRFFEEPTPPGDEEAIRRVARAASVPIAAGERAYDTRDCQRLIAAGVSVLQPDVIHVGGIARMMAVAELCDAASVSFAPHNASGPVATAATLQVASVAPTLLMQEMFAPVDTEWKDRVAPPGVEIRGGCVRAPDGPGLGVRVDGDEARRHPYVVRDLDLFGAGSVLFRPAGHPDAGRSEAGRSEAGDGAGVS
jgi:galactonate dehydratase